MHVLICAPLSRVRHFCVVASYALVNLDPSIRMVTVAYESDIIHFGMELVLSGPIDEDEETGTSFGAAMRRLGRPQGIVSQMPRSTANAAANSAAVAAARSEGSTRYEPQRFRGWCVLVAADHPAAATLLSFKEIGARKPCRGCDWDQGTSSTAPPPSYGKPSSFMVTPSPWMLRTHESTAPVRHKLHNLGSTAGLAQRNQVLTEAGWKDEVEALAVAANVRHPPQPKSPAAPQAPPTAKGSGAIGPTGFRRPQFDSSKYFWGGLHSPAANSAPATHSTTANLRK
jgi:hypothetical protein